MSSYPLDWEEPRSRTQRLHRAHPEPDAEEGLDAHFRVEFVHRLRFTSAAFEPDNPVLAEVIAEAPNRPARVMFFIDEGVERAWPELKGELRAYVAAHRDEMTLVGPIVSVPGGEHCKNRPRLLEDLLGAMDRAGLCRQSFAIVIGGGAVLDLVGFAAAVAHRGIRLIRCPTTTLGQCDSGVGVKNGINAFDKKNFCGSFSVPWAVINDERFLTSLSDRDWRSGFSEAVKVALIKDHRLFERIAGATQGVLHRDYDEANPLLRRAAILHLRHITRGGDPFETTTARPLDFGHWSAHKLEQMTDFRLRHGEAVAIGLALDVIYSAIAGLLDWGTARRVLACLDDLGFELYDAAMEDTDTLLLGIEEFRQHLGGQLTVSLIENIGRGLDVHQLDREKIRAAIDYLAVEAARPATEG